MSQRKIANIVYMIDGLGLGGAERLMIPLLANLDRQSFSPRVCVFQVRNGNPIAEDLKALGVAVDLLPIPYLRDLTALPRLFHYLRETQADLVHTQLEFANILGNLAARVARIPSVCTVHTIPSQEDMRTKTRLHQDVEFFCLRNFCDMVISVSDEAQRFHMDVGRMAARKTTTIYNGIDLARFSAEAQQADPQSVRREFGIPAASPLLITVAVLRELKGIQFMIRAMPGILVERPDVHYLIVGSGDHQARLVEEAQKQGVGDRVIFAGARKDIPALLSAADLFVLPTLTEALPTVLAEAMAVCLPILASRVGGVPEMVTDGVNGRLLPPGDPSHLAAACLEMLEFPAERAALGARGRAVVEQKFDVRVQAEQLQNLYRRLLDEHGKR
jgi:glycosyltransferase involved in cell wall biosynthesis